LSYLNLILILYTDKIAFAGDYASDKMSVDFLSYPNAIQVTLVDVIVMLIAKKKWFKSMTQALRAGYC
jgi:fumarate reductase subunit C